MVKDKGGKKLDLKEVLGLIFVALLLLFLAFAGIVGTLVNPMGAVYFVIFIAVICLLAWRG